MVDVQKFEELARLKAEIKNLEKKAKAVQTKIFEEGGDHVPRKVKTDHGTLTLTERESYSLVDPRSLILMIGQDSYNTLSSVPISKIKQVYGTEFTEGMISQGVYHLKSTSRYFSLRR